MKIEGGKITKISSYYEEIELPRGIWLRDFSMRIYPAISTGIVEEFRLNYLRFSPYAREWVERVIENEGKT